MRNILVTVMMIIVVALLFTSIISDENNGVRKNIQGQGDTANTKIKELKP